MIIELQFKTFQMTVTWWLDYNNTYEGASWNFDE